MGNTSLVLCEEDEGGGVLSPECGVWVGLDCPEPGSQVPEQAAVVLTVTKSKRGHDGAESKKPTAPGIPRRSPIQVLTRPDPA